MTEPSDSKPLADEALLAAYENAIATRERRAHWSKEWAFQLVLCRIEILRRMAAKDGK